MHSVWNIYGEEFGFTQLFSISVNQIKLVWLFFCMCLVSLFFLRNRFFLPSLRCLISLSLPLLPAPSPLSLSLPLSDSHMFFDVEFKATANVFFYLAHILLSVLRTPSMQSMLKENGNGFGLMGL